MSLSRPINLKPISRKSHHKLVKKKTLRKNRINRLSYDESSESANSQNDLEQHRSSRLTFNDYSDSKVLNQLHNYEILPQKDLNK